MAMAVARPAGATGRQRRTTSGRPASGRPAPGHVLRTRPLLKSVNNYADLLQRTTYSSSPAATATIK